MDIVSKETAYLQAGIPDLKDYLLSEELYWPITARGLQLPRLTIGGLLLSQKRLAGAGQHLPSLDAQLESIRSGRLAAWEHKARREFKARFGLWQNYIADYQHAPEQHAEAYPQEVRYRVMLHLLREELSGEPEEQQALAQLDSLLRNALVPTEFIWGGGIQGAFPAEVYWYLYGNLKT